MAITPYRPSNDPFDRLFNTVLGSFGGYTRGDSLMRAPETDVIETENEIQVVTDMPGFRRDEIDIDLENNILTISGEKRDERSEGEEGMYHLAERRYGRCARSFVLPRDVEQDQIHARFEDGVLTVAIPKSEKARRRRIEVQSGGGQALGTGAQSSPDEEGE